MIQIDENFGKCVTALVSSCSASGWAGSVWAFTCLLWRCNEVQPPIRRISDDLFDLS